MKASVFLALAGSIVAYASPAPTGLDRLSLTRINIPVATTTRPSLSKITNIITFDPHKYENILDNFICKGQSKVYGYIREKWLVLGGENGLMGCTFDNDERQEVQGRWMRFENGNMYWLTGANAAYGLHGNIFKEWIKPGVQAALGWPVSDYTPMKDNVGTYVSFQFGYIQDHPTAGVQVVYKAPNASGSGVRIQSNGQPAEAKLVNVAFSGDMRIVDDDWPDSDDIAYVPIAPQSQPIVRAAPFAPFTLVNGCDDEVRVEIQLGATVITTPELAYGMVIVTGAARLYEGHSCATDDLETQQAIDIRLIPTGGMGDSKLVEINLQDGAGSANIKLGVAVWM